MSTRTGLGLLFRAMTSGFSYQGYRKGQGDQYENVGDRVRMTGKDDG